MYSRVIKKLRGSAIKDSSIDKTSKIESGSQIINTEFDKYSFCGYDCTIINSKIGKFTSIGDRVSIGLASHPIDWVSTSPVFYSGRDSVKTKFATNEYHENNLVNETIIGNDVWIGQGVYIKSGINIGSGSIIGMGSIVTKDVAPYSIVCGNPAKLIRKRFDDKTIEKLLEIKWWDLNREELTKVGKYFDKLDDFIKVMEIRK